MKFSEISEELNYKFGPGRGEGIGAAGADPVGAGEAGASASGAEAAHAARTVAFRTGAAGRTNAVSLNREAALLNIKQLCPSFYQS